MPTVPSDAECRPVFDSVLNPDREHLEAVLRCLKCSAVARDGIGPVQGEEALHWVREHVKRSPGCA